MILTDKPVAIAADHRGVALKARLKDWLLAQGQVVKDGGAYGLICVQGRGTINGEPLNSPKLIRFTELTEKVEGKNTLQRRAKGDGKEWRKHGKIDTSIRYQALAALADVADETGFITKKPRWRLLRVSTSGAAPRPPACTSSYGRATWRS